MLELVFFVSIILFLFWRWFLKGNRVVPQMFHLQFPSFVRVHGQFLMTTIKVPNMLWFQYSTMRGVCGIFIAGSDRTWTLLCSLHLEFTLQISLEDVLQGRALQRKKFYSLSQTLSSLASGNHSEPRPKSGERLIFLFSPRELLDIFIWSLKKWPFDPGVHPLRG